MRTGYSYLRYSTPGQGDGDSVRRQTAAAEAWCKRNNVVLDTTRRMEDRGLSGYHGRHRTTGALGQFLAEVEAGRIERGSVLVLENLDRLSRESPWTAVPLLCSLVNADIEVVTLSPTEMTYRKGGDLTGLVLAVVEFGRGHSESASKAGRIEAVWSNRRKATRESGAILTRKLPAWIEVRHGKLALIRDRAEVVRRIFRLAVSGLGLPSIVKQLTADGVPCFGRSGAWNRSYVYLILTSPSAMGVLQPVSHGKPDGEPIPDYFPPCVDAATFDLAQAALSGRQDGDGRPKGGRTGKGVACVFGGLLWDAATRTRLRVGWQSQGSGGSRRYRRMLVSASAMEGRTGAVTLPVDLFEAAVLEQLREVDPADVLGEEPAGESARLATELAGLDARIRAIEEELAGDGDVPALARVAKGLEAKRRDVLARLTAARGREACPKTEAFAEAKGLAEVRDEPGRLRLRALLRTVIEGVWVLTVRRGIDRLAATQVFFRGGGARSYLLVYRPANRSRAGSFEARSFAAPDAGPIDLRKPKDVAKVERFLGHLDLADGG